MLKGISGQRRESGRSVRQPEPRSPYAELSQEGFAQWEQKQSSSGEEQGCRGQGDQHNVYERTDRPTRLIAG